jgi:hypothetical protein
MRNHNQEINLLKRRIKIKHTNMKLKITKRDVLAFILGIIFTFFLDLIFNWSAHIEAFEAGLRGESYSQVEDNR